MMLLLMAVVTMAVVMKVVMVAKQQQQRSLAAQCEALPVCECGAWLAWRFQQTWHACVLCSFSLVDFQCDVCW